MTATALPATGSTFDEVMSALDDFLALEPDRRRGHMSCYAMKGGTDVQRVLQAGYNKYFGFNALVRRYFPGYQRIEQEVLETAAGLLGGKATGAVTAMTAGGTESIFCAVHAAREWARETRPEIIAPEFVAPYSLHATFSKACHYLGVKLRRIPVGPDYRGDPEAMAAAIGPNTVGLAASAPCWSYGLYDPIDEIAAIARDRGLWMHVDACVGGFLAPFVKKAGHPLPAWDFSVEGVTSISADLHKFGFAAFPCSIVGFRDESLLRFHQVFPDDWPSMKYMAQAFSGSRPASSAVGAWTMFQYLGEDGYVRLARETMEGKARMSEGIAAIPGLKPWATDLSILVYESTDPTVPVEKIVGGLTELGWPCGGTLEPPLVHLVMDPLAAGTVDDYLKDLARVVESVRSGKPVQTGSLSYVD